jgi:hypothetical protein
LNFLRLLAQEYVSNVLGIGVPSWTVMTSLASSLGTQLLIRTLFTWIWIRALLNRAIMQHSTRHGTFNRHALLLLSFCMILASRLTMMKSLSLTLSQMGSCRRLPLCIGTCPLASFLRSGHKDFQMGCPIPSTYASAPTS